MVFFLVKNYWSVNKEILDCIFLSVFKFIFLIFMCIVIKNCEDGGNNNLGYVM